MLNRYLYRLAAILLLGSLALSPMGAGEVWATEGPASVPSASSSDEVAFNFVDVEIIKVAEFVSDLTGRNFIFDDRVKGKVTIIAPSKLKKSEAYNLFTSVLQLKGYALVPSGTNAFKIVPAGDVKQSGLTVSSRRTPVNEDYIVRIIQLENISSDEALKFLQPLISKNGYISSFGPGNMVMVIESGLNLKKLLSIVSNIDQPSSHEEPEVVRLDNSSAETLANMLNQGNTGSTVVRKGVRTSGQASKAVPDKRLNALVLFGSKAEKDAMKRLIALLDVPSEDVHGSINVYFLENGDAEEMSKVLQGMVTAAKTAASGTPGRPGMPTPAGASSPFQTNSKLTITPDKATNALVIIGSPADYASVLGIIRQLDRRRKQVYVEAMIVEASIDNLKDIGAKWRATGTHDGEPAVISGVGTVNSGTMQEILTGLSGLSLGGMTNYMDYTINIPQTDGSFKTQKMSVPGFAALFSMSEFEGVVNVLSSPQILTADNTEAEIVVGENVPFVTKTETTTTNPVKSIERKDVGISLKLTPQITEGNYVKLDLYQEISSVKDSSDTLIAEVGPTTTKRSTKTTVIVKDRETVVISGLMQERELESETRVPLLHRIPLLGWLFKYKSHTKEKTNLLVFLTPYIVRDAADLSNLTDLKTDEYARTEQTYQEGELLVRFKADVSDEQALEIINKARAEVIKKLSEGLYYISLRRGMDVEDGVKKFTRMKEVEYAEPNFRISATAHRKNVPATTSADILGRPPRAVSNTPEARGSSPVLGTGLPPSWIEPDTEEPVIDVMPEIEPAIEPPHGGDVTAAPEPIPQPAEGE